jgi:putative addiction module CopG family antidote
MEVQFTQDQEAFVRQAIAEGRYQTAEDAVRAAFARWEEEERSRIELLTALDEAEADLEPGRYKDYTDVIPKNKQEAQGLAEQYLSKMQISPPMELEIFDEHTIETDFGWVFFWNSKRYLETDEFQYALAGNTPLIVDRRDGSIHQTSTADSIEEIIKRHRRAHAPES